MDKQSLPQDLASFLEEGNQLSYEVNKCIFGKVTLLPLDELVLGEVGVTSDEMPFADSDPHSGEDGYYAVPAVSLVADCAYDPYGVLVWLPDQGVYGTWDIDECHLLTFPNASWSDIAADPVRYLDAQFHPDTLECSYLQPFPRYPFVQD